MYIVLGLIGAVGVCLIVGYGLYSIVREIQTISSGRKGRKRK